MGVFPVGTDAFEKYGEYIPKEVIESIERHSRWVEGTVTTRVGGGFFQHQRCLAPEVLSCMRIPPDPESAAYSHALSRCGSHHRARENTRVCIPDWSTRWYPEWWKAEDHHREGFDPHCEIRL